MEHSVFSAWEAFYVIVGAAAGALTGLQFVVMVLGAESSIGTTQSTDAFGTPTVVHFCAVLFISALLTAPWPSLHGPAVALVATGVAGVIYAADVVRRARRQDTYQPVLEDWIFHVVFPLLSYVTVIVSGTLLQRAPEPALFVVGGSALLLMFTGIHNAWDAVTYIAHRAISRARDGRE